MIERMARSAGYRGLVYGVVQPFLSCAAAPNHPFVVCVRLRQTFRLVTGTGSFLCDRPADKVVSIRWTLCPAYTRRVYCQDQTDRIGRGYRRPEARFQTLAADTTTLGMQCVVSFSTTHGRS